MSDWRLYYHVVWGTKDRLALIDPAWEKDLYEYIWGRAVTLDCVPHAMGGMPEHTHLVISIPPMLAVGSLVVQLKYASSNYVNENYAGGSFLWQAEYGVLSFSEPSLPAIVHYVEQQKKLHARNRLHWDMEDVSLHRLRR